MLCNHFAAKPEAFDRIAVKMHLIRYVCPTYGDCEAEPCDVKFETLTLNIELPDVVLVQCECGETHRHQVIARVAKLLWLYGVRFQTRHPENPPGGPPFTLDDILELVNEIEAGVYPALPSR